VLIQLVRLEAEDHCTELRASDHDNDHKFGQATDEIQESLETLKQQQLDLKPVAREAHEDANTPFAEDEAEKAVAVDRVEE
jgi:hypothetical protein